MAANILKVVTKENTECDYFSMKPNNYSCSNKELSENVASKISYIHT